MVLINQKSAIALSCGRTVAVVVDAVEDMVAENGDWLLQLQGGPEHVVL